MHIYLAKLKMMGKDDWHMHWEENWRADDVKIFLFFSFLFLEGICHMPPGEEDMKILGKIKRVLVENELHGEGASCDFQKDRENSLRGRILRRIKRFFEKKKKMNEWEYKRNNQREKTKRRKRDSGDVWEKDFDFQRRGKIIFF